MWFALFIRPLMVLSASIFAISLGLQTAPAFNIGAEFFSLSFATNVIPFIRSPVSVCGFYCSQFSFRLDE